MDYEVREREIEIFNNTDFQPTHILECGQIFSYEKTADGYVVYSQDKRAKISEKGEGFLIETDFARYFENFFDLKNDYSVIKARLEKFEIMKEPIKFGYGIRILKQNLFETLISFIISANNNIKRIQMILWRLRERLGEKIKDSSGCFYAFPTREQLLSVDENFFKEIGAGYRSPYLYKVLRQADENILQDWQTLPTDKLRAKLIALAGVGPKVADCVLLFGYGRGDVFPVDTWIHQMYNKFYSPLENREKIRQNLTNEFGLLSGYAQQYLFFYMREGENGEK